MKLKNYIEHLNALVKIRPEAAEFEVITQFRRGGKRFSRVDFLPQVGSFNEGAGEFSNDEGELNAVCLN